jgi:hypothetical protein
MTYIWVMAFSIFTRIHVFDGDPFVNSITLNVYGPYQTEKQCMARAQELLDENYRFWPEATCSRVKIKK